MSNKLKIVLIEDQPKDVECIIRKFKETVEWLRKYKFLDAMKFDDIIIEHVKGSVRNVARGEEYIHYIKSDISRIEQALQNEEENDKVGILTDILLTKREVERARVNDFTEIEMVNTICNRFEEKYPIYFTTGLLTYGSRAWSILGKEEMCRHYIQKELIENPAKKAIARAIYWLANEEDMPLELANKIEKAELDDL